jgi:O-antigen ligase
VQKQGLLGSITKRSNIPDNLLVIYFFFLFLLPSVSKVAFILLLVWIVFTGGLKTSVTRIKNDKYLLILCSYFFLHVIGLIWSANIKYGLNDVTTKLMFLLAPLVLSAIDFTPELFDRIKRSFIISSVLSLIILLVISFCYYLRTGQHEEFLYTRLSHGGHVTYQTIYLSLSLLFIEEKIFSENKNRTWYFIAFVFIFFGIQLMSARTSTIVAILTSVAFPIFIHRKNIFSKSNRIFYILLLILIPLIFFGYLHFYNRFQQVQNEIEIRTVQPATTVQQEEPNSTNIRINLWSNAVQLIRRNPIIGVGTGDIKEELVNMYTENHYQYGIENRISPHNQFLHTGVILGLVGIVLLAVMLFMPIIISVRSKEWIYFFFLGIILLNCMTESFLEREAGILFFTVFNSCFYLRMRSKKFVVPVH